jgi:hypothetical protein
MKPPDAEKRKKVARMCIEQAVNKGERIGGSGSHLIRLRALLKDAALEMEHQANHFDILTNEDLACLCIDVLEDVRSHSSRSSLPGSERGWLQTRQPTRQRSRLSEIPNAPFSRAQRSEKEIDRTSGIDNDDSHKEEDDSSTDEDMAPTFENDVSSL